METEVKTCSKCDSGTNPFPKTGRVCKVCTKAHKAAYHKEHRTEVNGKNLARYYADHELNKKSKREMYAREPEPQRQRSIANRIANPEVVKASDRLSYANNREVRKARVAQRRARLLPVVRALIVGAKSGPCVDCGGKFPPVAMDFDHVRGEKLGNISSMAFEALANQDALLTEIAKCELVCACCHRIRTATRAGWYKEIA